MAARSLKVVQILPALDGGGVERGTLEVAAALVAAGHQSYVISAGGRLVAELERIGARHIRWDLGRKSPLTLRYALPLRRWLRDQAIDIVHARSRLPAWIAWLAWRGMPAPHRPRLVTTVHGLYSINAYSAIMTRGERVIAVSATVRDYIQRHYPHCEPSRIALIRRGVDAAVFPRGYRPVATWWSAWYKQYPQLQGKYVITLPGRVTRRKGHEDFLALIRRLCMAGQAVHGLIVGGEDPRHHAYLVQLQDSVRAQGLSDSISFTGHRDDIREVYAASDLIVSLSSKPEAFGRVVLEALSLGRPVIAYDHGGIGEILRDIFAAGRVPVGDSEALYARVQSFMETPPIIPAVTGYGREHMTEQTLALYTELVS